MEKLAIFFGMIGYLCLIASTTFVVLFILKQPESKIEKEQNLEDLVISCGFLTFSYVLIFVFWVNYLKLV